MKYYLLELDSHFEMSKERADQLAKEGVILACPWHEREFGCHAETYHLTNGTFNLGILDIAALVRDVS
jgi:hypothetical protein